jgi:hypothetical protein
MSHETENEVPCGTCGTLTRNASSGRCDSCWDASYNEAMEGIYAPEILRRFKGAQSDLTDLRALLDKVRAEVRKTDDAIDEAWGIIANAYDGDWSKAPMMWKSAAERWRDKYTAEGSAP